MINGASSIFLGTLCLLILLLFLGSPIIHDRFDNINSQVSSLFCTFSRVQFDVMDVTSNATGEQLTRIDLTADSVFFQYYSYNLTEDEIKDVGLLSWNEGTMLAFSSQRLDETITYVIDEGRIVRFYHYGGSNTSIPAIKIENFHQINSFEDFILKQSTVFSILTGILTAVTVSLFSLPIIEYLTNPRIKKSK